MEPATLDDVLREVGELILAHLAPDDLCRLACVSRRCAALATTPALYASLSFDRLTQPRALTEDALATLCRRAGGSLRMLDLRHEPACRGITEFGLEAALQGLDRAALELRIPRPRLTRPEACLLCGVRWTRGLHPSGGAWRAFIIVGGREEHLGTYVTPQEAARAHDDRMRALGLSLEWLNYPLPHEILPIDDDD
jgi:hypothetical protein